MTLIDALNCDEQEAVEEVSKTEFLSILILQLNTLILLNV